MRADQDDDRPSESAHAGGLDAEATVRESVAGDSQSIELGGVTVQVGSYLERFLFDLFPLAGRAEVHEVRREWEFAPVKNAEGVDSLVSARVMVAAEVLRWHAERGLAAPDEPALRPLEVDGGSEYVGL